MALLLLSAGFAAIVAWCLIRAVRQARLYRSVDDGLPPAAAMATECPAVAVIIPARNEARNIGTCLQGVLAQDYPRDRLRVIVVDDGSTDDTASVVRGFMAGDDRLVLLRSAALPRHWAGKPFACWRGALVTDAEWLCFMDADTAAGPALIRTAISAASHRRLDMISLSPFQKLTGVLDRLVLPLGFFAVAVTRDLGRTNRPDVAEASVNGQFLLVRAPGYFAVGGHSAVRNAICEDSALAGCFKRRGFRIALLGGERLIQTRMYASARELWEGLSKNATDTFGGVGRTLAVAAGVLAVGVAVPVLPILDAVAAAGRPSWPAVAAVVVAAVASAAVIATQIALCRHFRIPVGYALLFPAGAVAGASLAINAVRCRWRGRVAWKGRVYAAARPGSPSGP